MHSLHWARSCAISGFILRFLISSFTHSCQIFLPLPLPTFPSTSIFLHEVTHSSPSMRSKCPNHRSLPLLTTSVTHSKPNLLINSSLITLSDRVTPHVLLTIALSVRSNLLASSTFIGH